ncbi:MAG: hypothetical protein M1828_001007 [Chrysothrix sp. TS-e1954]|nr:MAG: hypothetical protein M1828_001007 [Chrysothrix sp. TS-e1954]
MEVNRDTFSSVLPTILKRIADSSFVVLDLELSGIPHRTGWSLKDKPTLQQRYAELREAAGKYHILQVGLTCVEADVDNQQYLIRPFNINLTPLVLEDVNLERDFTFSTGAVDFLRYHGYSVEASFERGVPYMNRTESETVTKLAAARWDKADIPDIPLEDNAEALTFMSRARTEIKQWQKTKEPYINFYNVAGVASADSAEPSPLSRFEKRLTHQLVRSEFPELQTFSRTDFVSVQPRDDKEQKDIRDALKSRLSQAISRQTGFRWIAEALAGGDLSGIDPNACSRRIDGEVDPLNPKALSRRIAELQDRAKARKKVLIGHNCLLDMVYFYNAFYGALPDTVEEFQEAIHAIFPLILDTKYLSTQGSDYYKFRSSQLWQLDQAMEDDKLSSPTMQLPSDQNQYRDNKNFHEAGFDSFVTARVFLKLAAKLLTRENGNGTRYSKHKIDDKAAAILPAARNATNAVHTSAQGDSPNGQTDLDSVSTFNPEVQNETASAVAVKSRKKKSRKGGKAVQPSNVIGSRTFFSPNMFDNLRGVTEDDIEGDTAESTENQAPSSDRSYSNTVNVMSSKVRDLKLEDDKQQSPNMLEPWDSEFWSLYGNKLRVFGTVEEVCDLTQKRRALPTIQDEAPPSPSFFKRASQMFGW